MVGSVYFVDLLLTLFSELKINKMLKFITILMDRNGLLFGFGLLNLISAGVFFFLTPLSFAGNQGNSDFLKPFKFALSIALFSWTMAWYIFELRDQKAVAFYSWAVVATLGFEIVYISVQAARGQLSHYNTSSPFYATMTILMGVVAAILSFWTLYIGFIFFTSEVKPIPDYYLWAIPVSIILFVIFAFQGGIMGARLSHSVGQPEPGAVLPVVGWNTRSGDLRVAHFIGMHALQVIPILSWFVLKNTKATLSLAIVYALIAAFTFLQAINGRSFLGNPAKENTNKTSG